MNKKIALTPFMIRLISMIDKYDIPYGITVCSQWGKKYLMLEWIGKQIIVSADIGIPCSDKIALCEFGEKNVYRKLDLTYDGIEAFVKTLK